MENEDPFTTEMKETEAIKKGVWKLDASKGLGTVFPSSVFLVEKDQNTFFTKRGVVRSDKVGHLQRELGRFDN